MKRRSWLVVLVGLTVSAGACKGKCSYDPENPTACETSSPESMVGPE